MTSKQRQKKLDNLAKAREAKAKKNPPKYSMYAPEVVALPDDNQFSLKNVRAWIKEAKETRAAHHNNYRAGDEKALAQRETWTSYINQLESYLRTGNYTSAFAGGQMQKRVQRECIAMAYYPNGKPKREFGVFYKDCMEIWTPKLENEERARFGMEQFEYNDKGQRIVQMDETESTPKKKTKRKRKEMTPEQKAALVERLRKAREAKRAKANK